MPFIPRNYLRSLDGALMIEYRPGMFAERHMAEKLGLLR